MEILDILILGSGPAALCLASELAKQDLNIKGISTKSPNEKWENTYGIWASELEELGLESLLSHRWCKTVSFFGNGDCLLYTSPSPRDGLLSRMPSSA